MYTHIWHKYLPVIKILLKRSATADQKITLNRTDFEKGSRSGKPSCSFNIVLEKGRFHSGNSPASAKELVALLLQDETTKTLLKQNDYKMSLNSELSLRIVNLDADTNSTRSIPLSTPV